MLTDDEDGNRICPKTVTESEILDSGTESTRFLLRIGRCPIRPGMTRKATAALPLPAENRRRENFCSVKKYFVVLWDRDMKTDQDMLTRVREMEDRYDELTRVLAGLDEAISEYKDYKSDLMALKEYMESGQWKKDYEADEAGLIPKDMKRGVLSEDGLYDLLQGADKILKLAREVLSE